MYWLVLFTVAALVVLGAIVRARSAGAPANGLPAHAACSRCYEIVPTSEVRVLPWWNEQLANFVTSYRCSACFAPSLAETRTRIEGMDGETATLLSDFFIRHQQPTIAARIARGGPDAERAARAAIDDLERGALELRIG